MTKAEERILTVSGLLLGASLFLWAVMIHKILVATGMM